MFTLLLLLILFGGFLMGLRRGLILQAIHLFGFIISLAVAAFLYKDLGPRLEMWIPYPGNDAGSLGMLFDIAKLDTAFYNAIAFFIIFVATKLVLQIIGSMLDFLAQLPLLKQFNQVAGGAFGFVEAYLGLFILLYIIALLPVESLQTMVQNSGLAKTIVLNTPFLSDWVSNLWFHPFT